MNILLIDTASEIEIIAASSDRCCRVLTADTGSSHAATLFDAVDRCIASAGFGIRDTGLIAVGRGPGSFTGIRIAVTTARMMAQVLSVPLVGLESQEIYAWSLPSAPSDQLLIAYDAKKGRVFGAAYRKQGDSENLEVLAHPGDYMIGDLMNTLNPAAETISTGNGIRKYWGAVGDRLKKHRHIDRIEPDPARLRTLVLKRYRESPEQYDDFSRTVPLYARKSDAELMKETRGQGG